MSEHDSGTSIVAFLLGGILGGLAGLLLAPRSGDETRRQLMDWLEQNRERTRELIDREREVIHDKKEQIAAALDAGKKAYREAEHRS